MQNGAFVEEQRSADKKSGGLFQRSPDFAENKIVPTWSYWPDSNRRPADYESAALPTELQ
jgi:hypothetical protein